MEEKDWITRVIAVWGAFLSTGLGILAWWRSRRRLEVSPDTYAPEDDIGMKDYCERTALKNLAVRLINHSEYPIDVKSVGLWIKQRPCYRLILVPLECPDIRTATAPDGERHLLFKSATLSNPEPEREYKPVRVEPHNGCVLLIDPQENGRSEDLASAGGVYVRLADDSVYFSRGWWRALFSKRARQARDLFSLYCDQAIEKSKKAKESRRELRRSREDSDAGKGGGSLNPENDSRAGKGDGESAGIKPVWSCE